MRREAEIGKSKQGMMNKSSNDKRENASAYWVKTIWNTEMGPVSNWNCRWSNQLSFHTRKSYAMGNVHFTKLIYKSI